MTNVEQTHEACEHDDHDDHSCLICGQDVSEALRDAAEWYAESLKD